MRDSETDDWTTRSSLAGRFYLGSNYLKVLAEGEVRWEDGSEAWFLRGGAELKPGFGGWATLTAGLRNDRDLGRTSLVTDFSYNLGLSGLLGGA